MVAARSSSQSVTLPNGGNAKPLVESDLRSEGLMGFQRITVERAYCPRILTFKSSMVTASFSDDRESCSAVIVRRIIWEVMSFSKRSLSTIHSPRSLIFVVFDSTLELSWERNQINAPVWISSPTMMDKGMELVSLTLLIVVIKFSRPLRFSQLAKRCFQDAGKAHPNDQS